MFTRSAIHGFIEDLLVYPAMFYFLGFTWPVFLIVAWAMFVSSVSTGIQRTMEYAANH